MSYTTKSSIIAVGKAIKKSLIQAFDDGLVDHESRITNVEGNVARIEVFHFEVMGYVNHYSADELTQIGTHRATNDFDISEIKMVIMDAASGRETSTTGIMELDIEKSTDGGVTWNSILDVTPKIADGIDGKGTESSLAEFKTNGEEIYESELLRVNVLQKKDIQGSFLILVYGTQPTI